ncbi:3-phytase B [Aspergillus lentulus]|uniref:histidine phosphatase family protein n=1 Tax=Aspergillus lentulus TaxID=293939 RepID=UPI0013943471|nr:3-phytase B [Aspergillus lentulus]GFF37074.1 3-phytase B [Aspergillus lentulus]
MPQFLLFPVSAVAFLAVAGGVSAAPTASCSAHISAPTGVTFASGFDITTSWGNLSPYKDAPGFNVSNGVPRGCELSQVHVLHRHAQRYPVSSLLDGGGMEAFAQKVKNYSRLHASKVGKGPLAFLNEWEYMLAEDTLQVTGAATEATSGASIWSKYGRLLYRAGPGVAAWDSSLNVYPDGSARLKPIFRTTSQARILESARWWLSGFFGNTGANSSYAEYDLVIIPEGDGLNNTLASDHSCPGDKSEGTHSATKFIPRFTKHALSRLAYFLPKDFNLTPFDITSMMNLCPYETAALGSSAFCSLFTEQEWHDYAYSLDLQFYGNYGLGAPSGRAQGIGYVLELASRLAGRLIQSSDTSINSTYDDNAAQFPLHQPLYMDMSHDDVIVAVLAALGLEYFKYGELGLPDTLEHAPERTFRLNEIVPFGARFVSEVWTCPDQDEMTFKELDATLYRNPVVGSSGGTDYIRFVLNGAPVSTQGLVGCERAENGFCALRDFLGGVAKLKEEAMYQVACFGNYTSGHQLCEGLLSPFPPTPYYLSYYFYTQAHYYINTQSLSVTRSPNKMEFQSRIAQYSFDEMMIDDASASLDSCMGKHPCDLSATFNEALDSPSPPSTEEISDTETEAATEIVEETEGKTVLPSRLEVTFTTPLDGFDPMQRRLSRLTHRLRHSVLYFLSLYGISIQYALYPIEESGIQGVHDALPVVLLVATEHVPVSMWRKGVKRAYEHLVDVGGFPAIEIPMLGREARSEDGVDMRMSRECKVYLTKLVAREF